jgi:FkbM family methyltransferase
MVETRDELIERVKALYRRLQAGALTDGDVIPLASVAFENNEAYVEQIRRDRPEFMKAFAGFAETYDVFRAFGRDEVVVEVGAHWGYSVVAMRHGGCKARILSIEATPGNIGALQRLARVEEGRFTVLNAAGGEAPGELTLYIPVVDGLANSGSASTGATLDNYYAYILADVALARGPRQDGRPHEFRIATAILPAVRVDQAVPNVFGAGTAVHAMKIDVEGHEGAVLRGASGLLARDKPLVMIEGANRDPAVVAVMRAHGYGHAERRDGVLVPHEDYSFANDGFWVHPDRVAGYRARGIHAP